MANRDVKVSVIIPCYNDGKYLAETIESVLKSTFDQFEIIIVDDGSTDQSADVGKKYAQADSRITYHYQENAGLSTARNKGIGKASGQYILPLDADDLISKDYIKDAVEALDGNSAIKVVYCNAEFFEGKEGEWKLPPFSRRMLARENMIFCSALYRKQDWQEAGGYSVEMKGGWEDWEFWISLLKNGGEVVKLPLTGFFYRIKKNSMRKGMSKAVKARLIRFMNTKHMDFFQRELGGPLRTSRSLSRFINRFGIFNPRK